MSARGKRLLRKFLQILVAIGVVAVGALSDETSSRCDVENRLGGSGSGGLG